jgi:hypothetical protein
LETVHGIILGCVADGAWGNIRDILKVKGGGPGGGAGREGQLLATCLLGSALLGVHHRPLYCQ